MKPFWAKQGSYFVLTAVTTLTAMAASFFEILVVAAILALSIREGYEKRGFSLRFHLRTGAVFVIWHGILSWLCQCAWFSSGLLYANISDLLCYYLKIVTVQGKGRPLFIDVASVLLGDICVILPLAMLGNRLGARKYHKEVEDMRDDHEAKMRG